MKSVPFRAVLFALIGLVAIGSLITASPSSSKVTANVISGEACAKSGVTLVIDFGDQSRAPLVTCVKNFAGTGWQLFEAAGIAVEGTAEYPQSFVCRISEFPSTKDEDCLGTPNYNSGTWVYFSSTDSAQTSGWNRSPQGAASRKPGCGDFEGWRFVVGAESSSQIPNFEPHPFVCKP